MRGMGFPGMAGFTGGAPAGLAGFVIPVGASCWTRRTRGIDWWSTTGASGRCYDCSGLTGLAGGEHTGASGTVGGLMAAVEHRWQWHGRTSWHGGWSACARWWRTFRTSWHGGWSALWCSGGGMGGLSRTSWHGGRSVTVVLQYGWTGLAGLTGAGAGGALLVVWADLLDSRQLDGWSAWGSGAPGGSVIVPC
jgi:hypothetical protein